VFYLLIFSSNYTKLCITIGIKPHLCAGCTYTVTCYNYIGTKVPVFRVGLKTQPSLERWFRAVIENNRNMAGTPGLQPVEFESHTLKNVSTLYNIYTMY